MSADETSERSSRFGMAAVVLLLVVVGLPLLLFLPLILALAENFLFGTNEVEGLCRDVGIHDELGKIYGPLIDFFD